MYGYDYEGDVLLLLRLLRFLHDEDPVSFSELLDLDDELDEDAIFELSELVLFGGYCSFIEQEFDDENEMNIMEISHPAIDRFLVLSEEWREMGGGGRTEVFRRKVQDTAEFYFCGEVSSVFDMNVSFGESSALIRLTLSPDCYEPLRLANSLVDFLLYFKQENRHLECLVKPEEKPSEGVEQEVA